MVDTGSKQPLASAVHTISVHKGDVNSVAFSSNSLATCSGDKTVRLWSIEDFTEQACSPLCGHTYSVHCCVFNPKNATLATCSTDGKLIIWDAKTGDKLAVLQHDSQTSIRVCRFSPDFTRIVTGSDDEKLCIWDATTYKLVRQLEGHEQSVVAVAFSPDSAFVVSGSTNGDLRIWDAMFGHGKHLKFELDCHDLGVSCCEFSPTYGSAGIQKQNPPPVQVHFLLATCGYDNKLRLWDILTHSGSPEIQLKLRKTLNGHGGHVMYCCFSPNGRILASGSGDKTIRLWDPLRGEALHTIEGHSRYVTSCAFSMDGRYLASGSNDRTVKVWRIGTAEELQDELHPEEILVDMSPEPKRKQVEAWTTDEVTGWCEELGLGQYAANFRKNAIDGTELVSLTHDTLQKAVGIEAYGHRNKILRAIRYAQQHPIIQPTEQQESGCPDEYLCPITREIMKEPVMASDGYTYERAAILSWINNGKDRSPMTNSVLIDTTLVPNRSLKMLIQHYLQAKS